MQLGVNAYEFSFPALVLKLHETLDQREQRIVFAAAYIFARLPFRTALTRKDIPAENFLPAEFLQTQALRMRITTVS